MVLSVRESAKIITQLAQNVFIEEQGVKKLACQVLLGLKDQEISLNNFSQQELHPNENDPRAVDWIFVLDTLNFSFWSGNHHSKWTVNGQTGYFALCAAIKRAIDAGKPIIDAEYYSKITKSELEDILKGDNENKAPLMDERVKNLNEAGRVLVDKYRGTFVECVKSCNCSAAKLLELIVTEFESFRDEADFHGHKVALYKRAQILIGDIWACFKGQGLGKFYDIGVITMFPDYRIPQVLLHFGALRYSNPLYSTLQSGVLLKPGSEEEVEIRGCSIEIVERVREEVKELIKRHRNLNLSNLETECNAILIDHFLWDYRRLHADELANIPFHKVRTIYY